jgi:hypothetical protein
MGIFYDMTEVVNRGRAVCVVKFDGQELDIAPGPAVIPTMALLVAKNQNPVRGTAQMDNPTVSGCEYLIGIKGKDDCTPLTDEQWAAHVNAPSRWDMDDYFSERLGPKEHMIVRGKGRPTQAKSSFDAGVKVSTPEVFAEN